MYIHIEREVNIITIGMYVLTSSFACWSIRYLYKTLTEKENMIVFDWTHKEDEYEQLETPFSDEREEFLAEIKALEEKHRGNPQPQILKNCAWALIRLVYMSPQETDLNKVEQWIRDARLKLEEALKMNPDDLEAKFELGNVLYHYLINVKMERQAFIELCWTAMCYFKEVSNKAPGVYKDCKLERIKKLLPPADLLRLELSEQEEIPADEMVEDFRKLLIIKQNCEAAGKHKKIIYDALATLILKATSMDPYDSNMKQEIAKDLLHSRDSNGGGKSYNTLTDRLLSILQNPTTTDFTMIEVTEEERESDDF